MKWSRKLGTLAGIEIRVHATFLLLLAWVAWGSYAAEGTLAAALAGMLFIVMLFGIVVLHELGHALVARHYGVPTRDITLLPIGGVARLERMPEDPRHELAVAVAGPAVNVALALVLWGASAALGISVAPEAATSNLLAQLLWINVALAGFNMLPAFPLDGGRALRAVLAMRVPEVRATEVAAALGQGLAVLLGLVGLFGNPLLVLIAVFVWLGARAEATAAQLKDALTGVPVGLAAVREFHVVRPDDPIGVAVGHALGGFQRDFPVADDHGVVGLLSHRALLRALSERGAETRVADAMDMAPHTVDRNVALDKALEELERSDGRCLLVLDARGDLVGMLTPDAVAEVVAVREAARQPRAASHG